MTSKSALALLVFVCSQFLAIKCNANGIWQLTPANLRDAYPVAKADFLFVDPNGPFNEIILTCGSSSVGSFDYNIEVRYNGGKFSGWSISHADKNIIISNSASYYSIIDNDAERLSSFLTEGDKTGNYIYEFEPLDPKAPPGRYPLKATANMKGFSAAARFMRTECDKVKHRNDEKEAMSNASEKNSFVGRWSLGGVGGSANLLMKPDGSFVFSHVTSFSHQTITSGGRWQSSESQVSFDEGRGKSPMLCSYTGSYNTKYLAGCSLAGVMSRIQ